MKTGVLWGFIDGVGYGPVLRAGAPAIDDLQQIEDVDHAVDVRIARGLLLGVFWNCFRVFYRSESNFIMMAYKESCMADMKSEMARIVRPLNRSRRFNPGNFEIRRLYQ